MNSHICLYSCILNDDIITVHVYFIPAAVTTATAFAHVVSLPLDYSVITILSNDNCFLELKGKRYFKKNQTSIDQIKTVENIYI